MSLINSSPCRQSGLASAEKPFPCLEADWGDRPCPLDAICREEMRECAAELYRKGYPYASWVVRRKALGLCTECSLLFTTEKPTPENARELFGPGVLRITPSG